MEKNPHLDLPLEDFIRKNTKLGHMVTRRFLKVINSGRFEYDEIFNISLVGMMKAYRKYDPIKFKNVTKFSTYAVPMMIGEIQRVVREDNPGAKYPRLIKEIAGKIQAHDWNDKEPEYVLKEIHQLSPYYTKATLRKVKDAFEFIRFRYARSMQEAIYHSDGDPILLEDELGGLADYTQIHVDELLSELTEKERLLLDLELKGVIQKEIGKRIGVSQVQASRLLKEIKNKLKKSIKKEEKLLAYTGKGDIKEAINLLSNTELTYREISEKTDVPPGTVGYYAKRHRDAKTRKKALTRNHSDKKGMQSENRGDTDRAVQMLIEGQYNYVDISRMTGVPQGNLTRLRRAYDAGKYTWKNQGKRVAIKESKPIVDLKPVSVPKVTPEPIFFPNFDLEPVFVPESKEVAVAKEIPTIPTIKEAIEELKSEVEKEVREKVKKEMAEASPAEQTSKGTINRSVTFNYAVDGTDISVSEFIREIEDLLDLVQGNSSSVSFSLHLEAK